jgi:EAL domain-containing protein (putative c-di-GMP-specific phosphodiesterase class I)
VAGFASLVRWRHPRRGLIPPGDFLPAAEASGLVRRIDSWIVDEACAAARRFEAARAAAFGRRRAGREPFFVSVNVCGQDLAFDGFLDRITSSLRAGGMSPGALKLEITETTLMATGADEVLRGARDLGIGVALDDFGTGYSSLSHLRDFPVDVVKIDRSFIAKMVEEPEIASIVTAVIDLSASLSLEVIAEGIETPEQEALLREKSCDTGQGYLFGRAIAGDEVPILLGRVSP